MKKKKLSDLNPGELEKRKTIAEIRSKRFYMVYMQPAFWTFLIAVGVFIVTWRTGVIDYERIKNQRKSDSLRVEKLRLEERIESLELKERWLDSAYIKKEDSLKQILQNQEESIKTVFQRKEDSLNQISNRIKEDITQKEKELYYILADDIINYFKDSKRLSNSTINNFLKRFNEIKTEEQKQAYIKYFTNEIDVSENPLFKLRVLSFLDLYESNTIWFEKYCEIVLNTKIEDGYTLLSDIDAIWSRYYWKLYIQELKFVIYDGLLSTGKSKLKIQLSNINRFGPFNNTEFSSLNNKMRSIISLPENIYLPSYIIYFSSIENYFKSVENAIGSIMWGSDLAGGLPQLLFLNPVYFCVMLPEAITHENMSTHSKAQILSLLPELEEGMEFYSSIWGWLADESSLIPSELEYKYLIDFPNNLEVDQWTRWLNKNPELIYYYKGVYQGNEENFIEFKNIVREYWNENKEPLIDKFKVNN